jgi:hypothetical protein
MLEMLESWLFMFKSVGKYMNTEAEWIKNIWSSEI